MRYDDIFDRPIEELTDDEIRTRALELRAKARTTKTTKASKTAKVNSTNSSPKDQVANMLSAAMNNAKKRTQKETKKP